LVVTHSMWMDELTGTCDTDTHKFAHIYMNKEGMSMTENVVSPQMNKVKQGHPQAGQPMICSQAVRDNVAKTAMSLNKGPQPNFHDEFGYNFASAVFELQAAPENAAQHPSRSSDFCLLALWDPRYTGCSKVWSDRVFVSPLTRSLWTAAFPEESMFSPCTPVPRPASLEQRQRELHAIKMLYRHLLNEAPTRFQPATTSKRACRRGRRGRRNNMRWRPLSPPASRL
jgi:hypothetical protein